MKIGIVVDNELNNDIRVLREIKILKEQGFEIYVLCFGFRKKYKTPVSQINITRISIRRKLRDILFFILNSVPVYEWLWASFIKKFILRNEIEILHVHDLYMSRAAYSGIKKTGKDIPMILDLHENYPFTVLSYNWTKGFIRSFISRPQKWQIKEKEYLGFADGIIVLSSDFRDLLLNRHPDLSAKSFSVLPNVPDLSQLEYITNLPFEKLFEQNWPVIFYYGVIAERRGIFDALEVFLKLINENHKVNFLLIGPVDKKDKLRFFKYLRSDLLTNHIKYIPWIDSTELSAYLERVDICIAPFHKNPQHESGVANKIYDYMLGAKPVIASNCKPQQDLIEKYECGLIFVNMTEFHDEIIKFLNDKSLREKMGENGKNAIISEYNTEIVKDNLLNMYNKYLA